MEIPETKRKLKRWPMMHWVGKRLACERTGISPTFDYDALDRVTEATDEVGQQRIFSYDGNNRLKEERLTVNSVIIDQTLLDYDDADRVKVRTEFGGVTSAFEYDANGNLVVLTDPDQHILRTEYDPNNHPIKLSDQAGHTVTRDLDYLGRVRSVTDPNGNTTTFEYFDATHDGRLKAQVDPLGKRTEFGYDAHGNVTTVTDNASRVTTTFYDAQNRAIRVVGPAVTGEHPVTCFTYNLLGALTLVEAGHTLSIGNTCETDRGTGTLTTQQTLVVDDLGRTQERKDGLNRIWQFDYDVHGNVMQVTDP